MKKKKIIILSIIALAIVAVFVQRYMSNDQPETVAILGKDIGEFSTTNLAGETVTQQIFTKYDVNMIYLWSTG